MSIEVRDDTVFTAALPAGSWMIGGRTHSDAEPTAFGREAIYNYMVSALSSVASSGSASDLSSGTLPLGRLHGRLQDIANVPTWTQGDVIYFNGTNLVRLANGSIGQVLQSGGTGANPSWGTIAGAGSVGDVTAASLFGTDNRLIRSDGVDKGVQTTGITVSDINDISGTGFIKPASDDGGGLGDGSLAFSDLFLASGGVINFANSDVTITHALNSLALAGASSGYSFDAPVTLAAGAVATPSLVPTGDANTGIWFPAADTLAVSTGGVERARIDSSGSIILPKTTFANLSGRIYKDVNTFLHDFNYGNNGTVTTDGYNTFLGYGAGNFTMGATATAVHEGSLNTGVGYVALNALTTGNHNVAVGCNSAWQQTTGTANTGCGVSTLYENLTGNENSAFGFKAMQFHTSGDYNVAIGGSSQRVGVTQTFCTSVGFGSLNEATGTHCNAFGAYSLLLATGAYNIGLGSYAGQFATTGTANVFVGYNCGSTVASAAFTGSNNTFIGSNLSGIDPAMASAVIISTGAGLKRFWADNSNNVGIGQVVAFAPGNTGIHNIALGSTAQGSNAASGTASYNVALGLTALYSNVGSNNNMAIGRDALYRTVGSGTTGQNVGVGTFSGYDNTSGTNNTFIGYNCGRTTASAAFTGTQNTFIGANIASLAGTESNHVIIADGNGNKRIFIDNNNNMGVGVVTSFGTSAQRVFALQNGVAPSTSPANTGQFYMTSGLLWFRDANGDITQLGGSLTTTKALGGIGYATGAGGTVTQATSKATGVTLNKATGTITLNNAALAAATSVGFTLTNSAIAATDIIALSIKSGATADAYDVCADAVAAGSCRIRLRNESAGSLSEAVVLSYAVIKGVAA